MVQFVAALGKVHNQAEPLAASHVNRDRRRRIAAAHDLASESLAFIDEYAEHDAAAALRVIVDGQFSLKLPIALLKAIGQVRGAYACRPP